MLIATATAVVMCGDAFADNAKIAKIHADIEADYADVAHIDPDALDALPQDSRVLFDVREADEYGVSHLSGAIRVDPGMSAAQFNERYASLLVDKTAVFYCSVGRRSSLLAQRLAQSDTTSGASRIYNLVGGIFQWRNEERALVDDDGATDAVHPYNRFWGRLIKDKRAIRMR
ncbi:MAG: rhodanese-like domain-containing protein [Pseudomonadota bacterium]